MLGGCFILEGLYCLFFISDPDDILTVSQKVINTDGQDDRQVNMQHDRKTDKQDGRQTYR